MNHVFADTSFYAAIVNRRDQLHERAKAAAAATVGQVITTEFVLTETANFCIQAKRRAVFVTLVERLRKAPNVEIVPATAEAFERGLELFRDRPDKEWSLTDCISFTVMKQRGLVDALTGDQNFVQAGFVALLA